METEEQELKRVFGHLQRLYIDVTVTAEDIARGVRCDQCRCPVALAIARALSGPHSPGYLDAHGNPNFPARRLVRVDFGSAWIFHVAAGDIGSSWHILPVSLARIACDFDAGREVHPDIGRIHFELWNGVFLPIQQFTYEAPSLTEAIDLQKAAGLIR